MRKSWSTRAWVLVSGALLPVSNLLFFGTLNIYLGNIDEFEVGYLDIARLYLLPAILALLLLVIAGFLFRDRAWKRYTSFLLGVGILLWVQGTFLMWDYGVLDARGIDWEPLGRFAWLDIFVWLSVLVAFVVFGIRLARGVVLTSWVLIAVQAVSLVWLAHSLQDEILTKSFQQGNRPPEAIFRYSSSRNVLHIVLDSFQTDIFWELVQEENLKEDLEGFVLFWDNAGVSPYTSFSMPTVFSGRVYDGLTDEQAYYLSAMKNGFQNRLFNEGYTVNLVPQMSMRESPYTNYYDAQSVYEGSRSELVRRNAAVLLDIALFRQVPHLLRKRVYNENNWFVTAWTVDPSSSLSFRQKVFFRDYIENLNVGEEKPAYHFLHLWPPHPPYVTNEDGSYAGKVLPNTRENYKNESRSILMLFVELLEKLRQAGIYDETLIVLQGDHGGLTKPLIDGKSLDFMLTRLPALLAIKRRESRGPIEVSNAQTSLSDIARTVLEAEGLQSSFPGHSVFTLDPSHNRKRWYFDYKKGNGEDLVFARYSINGSIYESASYRDEGLVEQNIDRRMYVYGDVIQLGLTGNGNAFLGTGWGVQMDRYSWSTEHEATLEIPVDSPQADLVFSVSLEANVYPAVLPRQRIGVLANGEKVAQWVAESGGRLRFQAVIPRNLVRSRHLTITFEFPDAASPDSLGFGGDIRTLAIALHNFKLDLAERETAVAQDSKQ